MENESTCPMVERRKTRQKDSRRWPQQRLEPQSYVCYGRFERFYVLFAILISILGQLISYSDTAMFGFYGVCNDADAAHGGAIHNNRLQAVSYAMQGELKRWAHGFG